MNKSSRGLALSQSKGFTLIELLVVIAIIGLLASIILASMSMSRKKGRDARRVSDFKQVQNALELYYGAVSPNSYPAVAAGNWGTLGTALAPYLSSTPNDPINDGTNYYYDYQSTNGATTPNPCNVAPCTGYVLQMKTETNSMTSAISGLKAGLSCTTGANPPHNYCLIQ